MQLVPMSPPVPVPMTGGFDYVTVDAAHRRVYAAHTGARSLLIVDADTGAIVSQVKVGPMHGVAYRADGTKVYTGNGDDRSVSETDTATNAVARTVPVDGPIDAIAFDESNERVYAAEDDGTRMFVIDAKTMKLIGTVPLPGHKPEYLSVDPVSHVVYQNIADRSEVALIDPAKLTVSGTIRTPELTGNHPLQYDAAFRELVVGGANGVLSVYDGFGTKKFQTSMPAHVDQCDLNQKTHLLICAGGTTLSLFALHADAAPELVGSFNGTYHVHTVAFDAKTNEAWAALVDEGHTDRDFIQHFAVRP